MTVYCITRHYRAMDDWFVDENYLFPEKWLCETRLKHLQEQFKQDFHREDCCFVEYFVKEKQVFFIENSMHLEYIQQQEELAHFYAQQEPDECC